VTPKKLIEVALPIREISVESARQKSAQRGHISTLHLWWSRKPLAATRAVVFASSVPDPDHPSCPDAFRQAVDRFLRTDVHPALQCYRRGRVQLQDPDPYRPYQGIQDTARNRLLAFIAKWSPEMLAFEAGKTNQQPKPVQLIDDRSLIRWETADPENPQGQAVLHIARELVRAANGEHVPAVLDPFAGGGAIPLEAVRLGLRAIASDYNPVSHIILRATCEFPQKYGRAGTRTITETHLGHCLSRSHEVPNILVHDVDRWATWILERARTQIENLYPTGADGRPVIGYIWARTAPCSNPSCRREIPLLQSLLVCNKPGRKIALTLTIEQGTGRIEFGIALGKAILRTEGTMQNRGNVLCPFCEQVTPVAHLRSAGLSGLMGERMVAAIVEGTDGKIYRPLEQTDLDAFARAQTVNVDRPAERILSEITASDATDSIANSTGIRVHLYGLTTWGSLFNHRQLLTIQTLIACLHEARDALRAEIPDDGYRKAVLAYLALWINRGAMRLTSVGRWDTTEEKFQTPFDMAKISMMWGYPEANPFTSGTGGISSQLDLILRVLRHEASPDGSSVRPAQVLFGDSAHLPFPDGSIDTVVTDPPYFDEIAYADLSDIFYVWLKRAIGDDFPECFSTPLTPKDQEATALRHRHQGNALAAQHHFTSKLAACFAEARRVCGSHGVLAVMFAHQTTEAWTALVHALFEAHLNVSATYPIDTELKNRMRGLDSSALESSITVVCRPRVAGAAVSFKDVRKEIEQVVRDSVHRFWGYGFRGADLIVACYGPAVGVFGKYERVEKADGTPVAIPELLDLARRSARDAIAGEFHADTLSTLYFVWANLYGTAEQSWDDARLVVQIGGDENAMDLAKTNGIFVIAGSSCRLALLDDRASNLRIGADPSPPLIDALHRSMRLWKEEKRPDLVRYLSERDLVDDGPFWKLAQALFEVLPRETQDWKLVSSLLTERETLRTEAKRSTAPTQATLPGI
jgi:adenine-specific DNA methylase